jgi:cystathionine gamma-lyase
MVPVYLTSTYAQRAPGLHRGFDYSRTANPTRQALERNLAALEGARHALAYASGMGATNTILNLLGAGDHVVCGNDVYGGTFRILTKVYRQYAVDASFVDTTDLATVMRAVTPRTRLVWLESPTNPLLRICDIRAIARALGRLRRRPLLAVDNTFATPCLQTPLALGADLAVHSTTKYLGGHSDVVGGAIAVNDRRLRDRLAFYQNAVGAVPGPLDCFLVLRGTKTLAARMAVHGANAGRIARFLARHPQVRRVHYPGLRSHPQHALAKRQMRGFGGMISFELTGGLSKARRFVCATQHFTLAESLGGVESLIELPSVMTHASIPREERLRAGLADGLIRLSVGIEDVRDLVEDLARAFGRAR